ncbi:hypothetical protein BJ165DRAFT_1389951 [Panaeolus papilionaceus]|nr:hypothetical protein BJ165DRAFT_1389951 [Panaeolus papilionaceus]
MSTGTSSIPLPPNFNYAKAFGFRSTPAAIVFAILYVPLLPFFLIKSFKRPTYVYTVLTIFCAIRLVAFIIRAVLAGNDSAGQDLGLLIADEVLFGVGFAGLLYSSYTLVLDRNLLHSQPSLSTSSHPLFRIMHNRSIFRVTLTAGVVLGIIASTRASNDSHGTDSGTKALHDASTIILLLLTILLVLQTLRLLRTETQNPSYSSHAPPAHSYGQSHGAYILCLVAFLLLVREVFNTATMNDSRRQNEEQLWFPFVALPELLAVTLFIVPGLVPPRAELPK